MKARLRAQAWAAHVHMDELPLDHVRSCQFAYMFQSVVNFRVQVETRDNVFVMFVSAATMGYTVLPSMR